MVSKRFSAGLALALWLGAASSGVLVTDVVGKVESGGHPVPALAEIPDKAQLRLASGARLVVVDLANGREFSLRGNGLYRIEGGTPRVIKGPAVEPKSLPVADLPAIRIATGRVAHATLVMRAARGFNVPVPISPVRTSVLEPTPTLAWQKVDGASGYKVVVLDEDGAEVFHASTTSTELTITTEAELERGKRFIWKVEAFGDQGRLSDASARFTVLPAATTRRLRQLQPDAGDSHARRVLYAAQLQEAGATEEAKKVWRALAIERPNDRWISELAD